MHQWLKNLLVFVPALAAHQFDPVTMLVALTAFLSFSLCASSVYVLNDLLDLGRDRQHARKRNRPFASGAIPTLRGLFMIPLLLAAALILGLAAGPGFLVVLAGYYLLTLTYSLYLKRHLMIDVVALACLYGARLLGGSVADQIELSAWLAAFSLFLFVSLAMVKRCTELVSRVGSGDGIVAGRAYRVGDLPLLEAMAAASGFTAVLVLALYVNSETVTVLYRSPHRLWLICVIMIYWIGRTMMLAHRGDMPDDPVVFASTDRISGLCMVIVGLIVLASL
jgi:4-hydroxybenzoate polyprenyltransferase